MKQDDIIESVKIYVDQNFKKDVTGHGYDHMERVAKWSKILAGREGMEPFQAEVTGWLHDVGDQKLFDDPNQVKEERSSLIRSLGFSSKDQKKIEEAIESVSFRRGKKPDSLLGRVVQDADRLDAIGAIGIARTFAYGGAKGQFIQAATSGSPSSIQHFHDKLLKLKDLMNTDSGKQEAEHRHQFMLTFLEEFKREQNILKQQGVNDIE